MKADLKKITKVTMMTSDLFDKFEVNLFESSIILNLLNDARNENLFGDE